MTTKQKRIIANSILKSKGIKMYVDDWDDDILDVFLNFNLDE